MGRASYNVGVLGLAAMLVACGTPLEERPDNAAPTFVSLNPCIDAIVTQVAGPDQVLALSHYSRDPAASSMDVETALRFGVTGGTAEEVIALQPDMVLAGSFIAPATKVALEKAGLRVETFGSPANVDESVEQVHRIARLAQNENAGESLAAHILHHPNAPDGDQKSALLWQPGQLVAGEASLVAEHLRWAGFSNFAQTRGLSQADHITLEQVLADQPDLLLVAGDSPGQLHPVLNGEFTQMQIAHFDPKLFYCGGPTIPQARERLLEIRANMETMP